MIELNERTKKIDVSRLEIQRPLSKGLNKNYNHKEIMKEIHNIFLQLEDNYFYQVVYQEFLKYVIDENLEFVILEDPRFKSFTIDTYGTNLKNDMSFKSFTKRDYRNLVEICELLLHRIKLKIIGENLE